MYTLVSTKLDEKVLNYLTFLIYFVTFYMDSHFPLPAGAATFHFWSLGGSDPLGATISRGVQTPVSKGNNIKGSSVSRGNNIKGSPVSRDKNIKGSPISRGNKTKGSRVSKRQQYQGESSQKGQQYQGESSL